MVGAVTGGAGAKGLQAAGKVADKATDVIPTKGKAKCFVAGTLVAVAAGLMPIEAVAVGDEVWAWNEATGRVGLFEVVRIFENDVPELIRLVVNGEVIETTPEHPFYVETLGWVEAQNLQPGDTLRGPA